MGVLHEQWIDKEIKYNQSFHSASEGRKGIIQMVQSTRKGDVDGDRKYILLIDFSGNLINICQYIYFGYFLSTHPQNILSRN